MKKRLLAAGLTMAAIMTITACGDKTASEKPSEPTTVVETSAEENKTTGEADSTESSGTETTTAESKEADGADDASLVADGESAPAEEVSREEISEFAKKVQDAVSVSDIDALADLCSYPVFVSLKEGEGSEVETKEEFKALGADKLFTDDLMAEIAAVKPEALEVFGAGIIMGGENNIIFNKVDGKMAITGISLK